MLYVEALTVSIEVLELAFDGRKGLLVPADETISRRAREIERECHQKLKRVLAPLDAIHLASAQVHRCKRFVTMDKRRKDNQLAPLHDREFLGQLLGLRIMDPAELAGTPSQPNLGL